MIPILVLKTFRCFTEIAVVSTNVSRASSLPGLEWRFVGLLGTGAARGRPGGCKGHVMGTAHLGSTVPPEYAYLGLPSVNGGGAGGSYTPPATAQQSHVAPRESWAS